MSKLSIALKKQKKEIEKLKNARIGIYNGFGKPIILCFNDIGFRYADNTTDIQKKIDNYYYKSIEHFDGFHTADIEFSHLYSDRSIAKYQYRTKENLISLARSWRERVFKDFAEAEVTIVVYWHDGIWFLDTFNYRVDIEGGIYI